MGTGSLTVQNLPSPPNPGPQSEPPALLAPRALLTTWPRTWVAAFWKCGMIRLHMLHPVKKKPNPVTVMIDPEVPSEAPTPGQQPPTNIHTIPTYFGKLRADLGPVEPKRDRPPMNLQAQNKMEPPVPPWISDGISKGTKEKAKPTMFQRGWPAPQQCGEPGQMSPAASYTHS